MDGKKIQLIIPSDRRKNIEELQTAMDIFSGKSKSGLKISSYDILDIEGNNLDPDYSILIESIKIVDDSETYLLICKPEVTSSYDPDVIMEVIDDVIDDEENKFDMFYLSKWMDRCDLFTNYREKGPGIHIVDTISPQGFHCILFSPEGIRKILKHYDPKVNPIKNGFCRLLNMRIASGKTDETLRAITSDPNLIQYDISKNPSQVDKLKECRDPEIMRNRKSTDKEQGLGLLWVIIVFIIIFILICAFVAYRNSCARYINI